MGLLIADIVATLLLVGPCIVAVILHHLTTREMCPVEAAEAPSGGETCALANALGFKTDIPYVNGGHPADCLKWCCHEDRIDDAVLMFDWDRAERELTS